MDASLWTETLESFRERAGGKQPVPAGVAVSAVSASFALALLAKVLEITGNRKDFSGDRQRIGELASRARAESAILRDIADDDVRAFNRYIECLRSGDREGLAAAARQTIDVPLNGARAAVRGLDLCTEGAGMVRGLTAADLGMSAALLAGAVRAILLSVDANLREMHSDTELSSAMADERRGLEAAAARQEEAVRLALERHPDR